MTSYCLHFSSYLYSVLLSGCEATAKRVKLSEQNEGDCFPEDTQSYTLLPQQKLDLMG